MTPTLTRRRALGAAATAVAVLALTPRAAGAQALPQGAELADGSGDPEDLPSRRPAPAGRTTSTAGASSAEATADYASQNGWPVPATNNAAAIGVSSFAVPGTSTSLPVRSGDVATVLVYVAQRFAQSVQPLGVSCGGYAWRDNVNSPGTWSNHASGTAIDLNWNLHPNGARGTFTAAQAEVIRSIMSDCRGVVRWGGEYTGTVDEMHFEINVAPDDTQLAQLAADIRATAVRRLVVLCSPGAVYTKDGRLDGPWAAPAGTFTKVAADGSRVGALTPDGAVLVMDTRLGQSWVTVATGIKDFALGAGRIAVIDTKGGLWVKAGSLSASWSVLRTSGVTRVALSGNRLAAVRNGAIEVKEGSVSAAWSTVAGGTDVDLDSRRLGVVSDGTVYVKDGPLTASWVPLATGQQVRLSGDRIGVLDRGSAYVKQGVYGSWVRLTTDGVTALELSGDRTGVLYQGGAYVKEGSLDAGWIYEAAGSTGIALAG